MGQIQVLNNQTYRLSTPLEPPRPLPPSSNAKSNLPPVSHLHQFTSCNCELNAKEGFESRPLTLSPFARLMALSGRSTLNTRRIFTTEIAPWLQENYISKLETIGERVVRIARWHGCGTLLTVGEKVTIFFWQIMTRFYVLSRSSKAMQDSEKAVGSYFVEHGFIFNLAAKRSSYRCYFSSYALTNLRTRGVRLTWKIWISKIHKRLPNLIR